MLNSNPLTVQVDGTVYSINGKLSRLEGFPVRSASGAKGMSPGGTHWVGESADGFGSVSVMDDGEVDGDLTLRGRFFRVTGRDNIVLLVELDATRLREVRPSTPAVSGVPK